MPYGYTEGSDGTLVDNPEEQATILRARQLRGRGLSLRRVAALLAAEGRFSRSGTHVSPTVRSGKPFDATQIARMLSSKDGGAQKTESDD